MNMWVEPLDKYSSIPCMRCGSLRRYVVRFSFMAEPGLPFWQRLWCAGCAPGTQDGVHHVLEKFDAEMQTDVFMRQFPHYPALRLEVVALLAEIEAGGAP